MELKEKIIGIYKIISPSGKVYIGQSINIEKRFNIYKRLDCKSQPIIYNSLKKYGPENHIFEIIEECSLEQLDEREVYWKLHYNSFKEGLNCELYDSKGGPRSEEVKRKIGEFHKGNSYNKGKVLSEEQKQKISISNKGISRGKGRKFSKKHILNLSKSRKGLKRSEETKFNISKSLKGKSKIKKSRIIIQYSLDMNPIKEWTSAKEIENKLKFNAHNIRGAANGNAKSAYNYKWKYKII